MTELRCCKCNKVVMKVEGKETKMRTGTVQMCRECHENSDESFDAIRAVFGMK